MADEQEPLRQQQVIPRRVRIQSQGPISNARFTDADTGAEVSSIYRAKLTFDWSDHTHPMPQVELTMLFPSVDVVADVNVQALLTYETRMLRQMVNKLYTYVKQMPPTPAGDSILGQARELLKARGGAG